MFWTQPFQRSKVALSMPFDPYVPSADSRSVEGTECQLVFQREAATELGSRGGAVHDERESSQRINWVLRNPHAIIDGASLHQAEVERARQTLIGQRRSAQVPLHLRTKSNCEVLCTNRVWANAILDEVALGETVHLGRIGQEANLDAARIVRSSRITHEHRQRSTVSQAGVAKGNLRDGIAEHGRRTHGSPALIVMLPGLMDETSTLPAIVTATRASRAFEHGITAGRLRRRVAELGDAPLLGTRTRLRAPFLLKCVSMKSLSIWNL